MLVSLLELFLTTKVCFHRICHITKTGRQQTCIEFPPSLQKTFLTTVQSLMLKWTEVGPLGLPLFLCIASA